MVINTIRGLHARENKVNWKKFEEALIKLTPQGKTKMIVDQQLKEIKTLEGFTDKGKYMTVTAFDYKKRAFDKSKAPAPFQ
jgi:hypothetical protein